MHALLAAVYGACVLSLLTVTYLNLYLLDVVWLAVWISLLCCMIRQIPWSLFTRGMAADRARLHAEDQVGYCLRLVLMVDQNKKQLIVLLDEFSIVYVHCSFWFIVLVLGVQIICMLYFCVIATCICIWKVIVW